MEAALLSAYRKHYGSAENVRVQFDGTTGNIRVLSRRQVVDKVDVYKRQDEYLSE